MKKSREEGVFEIITGPMFSGKTTTLVKKWNDFKKKGYKTKCFKPALDNRYAQNHIVTHSGTSIEAVVVNSSQEILNHIEDLDVLIIDEIQFFDTNIITVVSTILSNNITVVGSGLEFDYMGNHFGEMKQLKKLASSLSRLTGSCNVCNKVGTHTYRKNKDNLDTVVIGSDDIYEIRCETCYGLEQ